MSCAALTEDQLAVVKDRTATQFVGDPDEVADGLAALQRVTGADELVVTSVTHRHEDRLRSHELLAGRWGITRLTGLRGQLPDRPAPHVAVAGDEHVGLQQRERAEAAHAVGLVVVEHPVQQLRAAPGRRRVPGHQRVAADQHAVHQVRAVPTGVAGRGNGDRTARQRRGHVRGERLRGRDAGVDEGALAGDLGRPHQPARLPGVHRHVDRRRLLEILALGVADLVGVAVHRGAVLGGEPDRRAEMVDVGVRQQDCVHIVGVEAELAQRRQHVGALAGKAGVDEQHAVAVGDQRPVHQVGLGEVDDVGDLTSSLTRRCHARESRAEE